MRRWVLVAALAALVLVGIRPAAAQTPEDDACMRKNGIWDAEQGRCIVGVDVIMTAAYPMELVGMPYAEQAVDDFFTQRRAEFLGALVEYGPVPSPAGWEQNMQYEVFEGDRYTSLLYTVYEYMGGAHGNTVFYTFIFDHANARVIGLADLFTDTAAALDAIAPMVRDDLHERLGEMTDDEWLNQGTAPTEENYHNVVLTADALVFYFPPYQVASYAAGPSQVAIPLTAVTDYLAIPLE